MAHFQSCIEQFSDFLYFNGFNANCNLNAADPPCAEDPNGRSNARRYIDLDYSGDAIRGFRSSGHGLELETIAEAVTVPLLPGTMMRVITS